MHFQSNLECFHKNIYSSNNIVEHLSLSIRDKRSSLLILPEGQWQSLKVFYSYSLMHFQTNLECFYKDMYSSNNIVEPLSVRDKHSSLFCQKVSDDNKKCFILTP